MNEEDVIYTQWNITQPSKRMNNVICSNMDGPRDYHTKQSKLEIQIPYDLTYVWNLAAAAASRVRLCATP